MHHLRLSFLHLDVEHLLVNLYLLLIFGPQVERIVRTPRFLALYLLTGAFGFLASLLGMPGTLSVGASASLCRRRRWEARGAAFLLVAFAFAALYPPGASAVFLPVHPTWAKASLRLPVPPPRLPYRRRGVSVGVAEEPGGPWTRCPPLIQAGSSNSTARLLALGAGPRIPSGCGAQLSGRMVSRRCGGGGILGYGGRTRSAW